LSSARPAAVEEQPLLDVDYLRFHTKRFGRRFGQHFPADPSDFNAVSAFELPRSQRHPLCKIILDRVSCLEARLEGTDSRVKGVNVFARQNRSLGRHPMLHRIEPRLVEIRRRTTILRADRALGVHKITITL
jgi:hypothetical protein